MPSAAVTCPHCEKPVEIQVTAVTRSRPCPDCGQTIMLQVAGRAKHKALLMSPKPPTDQFAKPEFTDESNLLPGDAFERMCQDPELIHTRKQFMMGAMIVGLLSLVAVGLHLNGTSLPWMKSETTTASTVETLAPLTTASMASVPLLPSAQALKRIEFRPARGEGEMGAVKDETQAVLEKFLAAPSVDEKLALVQDAVGIGPALRKYYQSHPSGALSYSHIERHPGGDSRYTEFRVVMRDGMKKFAAVVPTSDGPRVDWASFVAHGDLDWEQMRRARPVSPVLMRVLATKGAQFSGAFGNAAKLRCIRLAPATDPSAKPLFGYVPLESEAGRQLGAWLDSGEKVVLPLTVKICFPQESLTHDQAWISEIVQPGWVMTKAQPTDEGQ